MFLGGDCCFQGHRFPPGPTVPFHRPQGYGGLSVGPLRSRQQTGICPVLVGCYVAWAVGFVTGGGRRRRRRDRSRRMVTILSGEAGGATIVSGVGRRSNDVRIMPPSGGGGGDFLGLSHAAPLRLFFAGFGGRCRGPADFDFFLMPLTILSGALGTIVRVQGKRSPKPSNGGLMRGDRLGSRKHVTGLTQQCGFSRRRLP